MYHKIGTLAKRFGITTQALRFYERHGLLLSTRESEGGDRRYQSQNLKWLYSIRRYHDLGYSLEETLILFSRESVEELDVMAAEKEAEILQERELLNRRLEALRRHREDLERIPRLFHRCEMAEMPRMWLVVDQKGQDVNLTPELQDEIQGWMRFLPWVYAASIVDGDLFSQPDSKGGRRSGFCVEVEDAERLGLVPGPHAVTVGGRRAIHTVSALDQPGGCTTKYLLGHAMDYGVERGMKVISAIGRCLAKTGEDQCKEDLRPRSVYYEYWLLIEE